MKRTLAMLLAVLMIVGLFAGCKKTDDTPSTTKGGTDTQAPTTPATDPTDTTTEPEEEIDPYTLESQEVYNAVLGEFMEYYNKAIALSDTDERLVNYAIAEAKMLESGVLLPTTRQGGNYAITKTVYKSVTSQKWGNDSERFHNLITTNEMVKAEDWDAMKTMWAEAATADEYITNVKAYLAEHGYTIKDTYTLAYADDPVTWDAHNTSSSADSEAIVNTYDGLMEYDCKNNQQPALAESYDVSDDGLTYTYHIRQGAKWVDSQGREVADVTADDFVAGMQHLFDCKAGLETLLDGIIVGAHDYIEGNLTDFTQVGVEAVDDYTLVYTLETPAPFFPSMVGYNLFAPLCRSYYESLGGKFGAEYAPDAEDYKYGKTPDTIAYCGPYIVSNATEKNTIVFQANPLYWNKDNIQNKTITWIYDAQDDPNSGYYGVTRDNTRDGSGLTAANIETAKADGLFEPYAHLSETDATSFCFFLNINRNENAYANVADPTKVVSPKTEEQKVVTRAALSNVHFRRAFVMSADRAVYNEQVRGADLKLVNLCNSYVPGDFDFLKKDVTVDINGVSTTFPAGTYYGAIMQAVLDSDGVLPVKVWDAETMSGDGFDGWYNPEAAKAELAIAIEELKAEGIEITAENPVTLDFPYPSFIESFKNKNQAFKKSVEETTEGLIQINLTDCADATEYYGAGYRTQSGAEANYDIYDVSGWSPDYGDPKSYLDTMLPNYAGFMTKTLGVF